MTFWVWLDKHNELAWTAGILVLALAAFALVILDTHLANHFIIHRSPPAPPKPPVPSTPRCKFVMGRQRCRYHAGHEGSDKTHLFGEIDDFGDWI